MNGLRFAFEVEDADIVALPATADEHAVDGQDRVEIFLWSGNARDPYGCLEVSASGAVHDYLARFYRRFDDGWSAAAAAAALRTTNGYVVEGMIPHATLGSMGFRLRAGEQLHCGLFRAEFRAVAPRDPVWITWVDPHTAQPDFHVAGAFGVLVLAPP